MSVLRKFFGNAPFAMLLDHTKKVHECVRLLRPLAEAVLEQDMETIEKLHHEMSRREHEADETKASIREKLAGAYVLSVRREDLMRFLSYQDDVADSAEDFAVVVLLRKTTVPDELKEDLLALVDQVTSVSEHLLSLAEELSVLAESAFGGKEAEKFLTETLAIGEEEWQADKLQRRFGRHAYQIEDQLDPTTLRFLDKYCLNLSAVANNAERAAKFLRQMVVGH